MQVSMQLDLKNSSHSDSVAIQYFVNLHRSLNNDVGTHKLSQGTFGLYTHYTREGYG